MLKLCTCFYYCAMSLARLVMSINTGGIQNFGDAIAASPSSIVVVVVSAGFGLSIIMLAVMHTVFIVRGVTTNEHINERQHSNLNRGIVRNFLNTLCGPRLPSLLFASRRLDETHPVYGHLVASYACSVPVLDDIDADGSVQLTAGAISIDDSEPSSHSVVQIEITDATDSMRGRLDLGGHTSASVSQQGSMQDLRGGPDHPHHVEELCAGDAAPKAEAADPSASLYLAGAQDMLVVSVV